MYQFFLRPLFFLLDAERAHYFTLTLFRVLLKIPFAKNICRAWFCVNNEKLKVSLFGLEFPNPVGLAAGFDKNAVYMHDLACLGFGFIEVGTVTPLPQSGNEKPRLFRLPKDAALINRLGFNNDGVQAVAERLRHRPKNIIIGGNIGKNKNTPNEKAVDDYEICFTALFDVVDYFTVNVSSPNTPGLRALQDKEPLLHILNQLQKLNLQKPTPKPILLKIAPDLNESQLDDIIDIVNQTKINGIIATNTTISREGLKTPPTVLETLGIGGLSGKPLADKSNYVIDYLKQKSDGRFPIVGVGGIMNAADARKKMASGATLIQLYTGFIYAGPTLVKDICKAILKQ